MLLVPRLEPHNISAVQQRVDPTQELLRKEAELEKQVRCRRSLVRGSSGAGHAEAFPLLQLQAVRAHKAGAQILGKTGVHGLTASRGASDNAPDSAPPRRGTCLDQALQRALMRSVHRRRG